ncbi:Pls/PosA family non-ribosomal peptide synthetase [Streptomyces sp. NPDC058685]|uniref:Pls/PosA family non-ribosomal peptide synthetase n=1 Tax=Streptomyces sp. NPDC058685 TaxID=3346598 RepID=UPI003655EF0A
MAGNPAEALLLDVQETSAIQGGDGLTPGTETVLAAVLADVVSGRPISVDSNFFDDLGADSLVMAQFCARVRKLPDLPSVSMKDIYRHPTLRSLSAALVDCVPAVAPVPAAATSVSADVPAVPVGRLQYLMCGALQLLAFLGYSYLLALVTARGVDWISAGVGVFDVYLRSVAFGAVGLLIMCAVPIVLKWVLIGRWKSQEFGVWSLAYVRFWIVKTLVRSNPLVLFIGSPLYVFYLRALGASVGRGVAVFSRSVPVCTDLLVIGEGTVIRKDSLFSCYRAHAGVIQTGTLTLGKNVVVSEATVLDIDASVGDGAQLAHASSLHRGQAVPDGEHWHGSPAQRSGVEYRAVAGSARTDLRRVVHSALQLLSVLLVYVPVLVGGVGMLVAVAPHVESVLEPGPSALTSGTFFLETLAASAVLFFGAVPFALLVVGTLPRLLNRAITPGKAYPLYGFHYGVHRAIAFLTNRKFLMRLFGDSSGIVHYLRFLGYGLSTVEQTGSNFGTQVKQESPYLSSVGTGTMVADGLSIMNADFSSTSFRVSPVSIGARNFLGNRISYPAGGRTGDNCLLATKVMVPVDGKIREGVGLLGSPSFEIPRSVQRDSTFDALKSGKGLRSRLASKNRHNVATMGLFLLVGWIYLFGVTLLFSAAAELYPALGASAIALANVSVLLFTAGYFVLVERAVTVFHPLAPLFCSIYDRRFWRRERYWKVPSETHLQIFNGTPFKTVIWRLLGVRIGRRVFDDGCMLTERTMAAIGDGCTLNAGSVVQCHSQEDGAFKSDRSSIGAGCTLGVGAFVHYGVTIGDGAVLASDSFLMKGEVVPEHAQWGGNPARQLGRTGDEEWRQDRSDTPDRPLSPIEVTIP